MVLSLVHILGDSLLAWGWTSTLLFVVEVMQASGRSVLVCALSSTALSIYVFMQRVPDCIIAISSQGRACFGVATPVTFVE